MIEFDQKLIEPMSVFAKPPIQVFSNLFHSPTSSQITGLQCLERGSTNYPGYNFDSQTIESCVNQELGSHDAISKRGDLAEQYIKAVHMQKPDTYGLSMKRLLKWFDIIIGFERTLSNASDKQKLDYVGMNNEAKHFDFVIALVKASLADLLARIIKQDEHLTGLSGAGQLADSIRNKLKEQRLLGDGDDLFNRGEIREHINHALTKLNRARNESRGEKEVASISR